MPEDIVKQGYVQVKSKHLGTWNKRWLKLRNERNDGMNRLEKYADEATAKTPRSERTTYELDRIHYVGRICDTKKKHAIRMILDDSSTVLFALDSEMEAENWLTAIQELKSGILGSVKKKMFEVYLHKSMALDASGECLLDVRADCICLLDIDNPQRVQFTWPLSSIRKYRVERGMFHIETGRSSPTGEGQFMFECLRSHADDIYDCVQQATAAMVMAKTQQPSPAAASGSSAKPGHEAEINYHSSMKKQTCYGLEAPPPYTAPGPPATGQRSAPDYLAPDGKQSTRNAARSSSRSGSNAYDLEHNPYNSQPPIEYTGPGRRGQSGNTGVSGVTWKQDDIDDAYYTSAQQPITLPGPKKNSSKNQTQAVCYEEAAAYNASGSTYSWQRDENDDEGEYYVPGASVPSHRQGSTSSSRSAADSQRRQGSASSSSRVTNQSVSDNIRKTVSRGTSTSTQVYASIKDEDDKNFDYALKDVFGETGLHLSRAVDRLELQNQ